MSKLATEEAPTEPGSKVPGRITAFGLSERRANAVEETFMEGMTVKITFLPYNAFWNGERGRLLEFDAAHGLWQLQPKYLEHRNQWSKQTNFSNEIVL
eukprot:598980-Karenia_brevis.AAC.1